MLSLESKSVNQEHRSGHTRIGGPELRMNTYTILASLLHGPPDSPLLKHLASIESDDPSEPGTMGRAWMALKQVALKAEPAPLAEEYQNLFIGLGRGEVVPFGSWHLTGFLMDKPLSDLRNDLEALGIVRDDSEKDPEDHISALCETMALLIQADDVDEQMERRFFACHLHPWATKFFKEVQKADSANFYKHVGCLGQSFMEVESHYLNVRTH